MAETCSQCEHDIALGHDPECFRYEHEAFALGFNAYRARVDAALAALDAEEAQNG